MAERELMDFPSNSKTRKPKITVTDPKKSINKKDVKSVVTGKVTRRKTPLSKKFSNSFFNEDFANIKDYIILDVLIPSAKNMLYDIAMNSLGMSLFGQITQGRRYGNNNNNSHNSSITNYRGMSSSLNNNVKSISNKARATHQFDDITFANKFDAQEVLDRLDSLIDIYDQATVGDLYDLVGISSTFADQSYGWTRLNTASIKRDRDGYRLMLPRTELLD